MPTRFDLTRITSWSTTTHREVAAILGCAYVTAVSLRTKLGLPKAPRKPGSGSNRYKNHPPMPRRPWDRVTDWGCRWARLQPLWGAAEQQSENTSRNTGRHYEQGKAHMVQPV